MINIKRLGFIIVFFSCFFLSLGFNAQKINQFNKNRKRTGVWKKYHPNKRIRYTGTFENGKEVGVFKFYSINSSSHPIIVKEFIKEKDVILTSFFSEKGVLQSKGYYQGKKRVGNWLYYFDNKKIRSEENYVDGKLEGKSVNYYPNGKATEISFYKNGLLDGVSKKYSSKGILIEEVTYKEGKPNGVAKYFELNGNLKETGSYKQGKRIGNWEYYFDGKLATEEEIKNKKKFNKNE